MRVLISSTPGLGHFFPLVPLAWAFRSAGHDVLVATTGKALDAASGAGLGAVDVLPGRDVAEVFKDFGKKQAQKAAASGSMTVADPIQSGAELFTDVCGVMAEGTVAAARTWRPDVVIHPPLQAAGTLAAALLEVPAVRFSYGLGLPQLAIDLLHEGLRPVFTRLGLLETPPAPAVVLDSAPPSMRLEEHGSGWPVRFIPYNGGAELGEWLEAPARPRVLVTLGSLLPEIFGVIPARGVVKALRELDVEALLALNEHDASALGALPENARIIGWVPLSALVPTCAAVVHHGGTGSTFNALVAGVPQLARPLIGNDFLNADTVVGRGVGLKEDSWTTDPGTTRAALERLLGDPAICTTAREVRDEIAAMPVPAEVVPRLVELAGVA